MHKVIIAAIATVVVGAANASNWHYSTQEDKMTDKEIKHAISESDNSISLDFPYQGRNHGNLNVRRHPQWGTDFMFYVDKGQLSCGVYDCDATIRFDNDKPMKIKANRPADRDSTLMFLKPAGSLISRASKANRIIIQVGMYRSGQQTFEFKFEKPLEWAISSPSKNRKRK